MSIWTTGNHGAITPAFLSHIQRADTQELGQLIAVLSELTARRIAPGLALTAAHEEFIGRARAAHEHQPKPDEVSF